MNLNSYGLQQIKDTEQRNAMFLYSLLLLTFSHTALLIFFKISTDVFAVCFKCWESRNRTKRGVSQLLGVFEPQKTFLMSLLD